MVQITAIAGAAASSKTANTRPIAKRAMSGPPDLVIKIWVSSQDDPERHLDCYDREKTCGGYGDPGPAVKTGGMAAWRAWRLGELGGARARRRGLRGAEGGGTLTRRRRIPRPGGGLSQGRF